MKKINGTNQLKKKINVTNGVTQQEHNNIKYYTYYIHIYYFFNIHFFKLINITHP